MPDGCYYVMSAQPSPLYDQLGFFNSDGSVAISFNTPLLVERILDCASALAGADMVDHRALKDLGSRFDLGIQDRYNAIEAMLVRMIADGVSLETVYARLEAMPAQSLRSLGKDDHQQFSTPPKIATAAARLASFTSDDIVLEPSAGTGLLAAFAARAGVADLCINEIDPVRLGVAQAILHPRAATAHDATFLHALFQGAAPSVVLMNPPFSVNAQGNHVGSLGGLQHLASAIHLAADRARIVAILGANQHPDVCTAWNDVIGRLPVRVRAAFTVAGRDFYRMGTTFETAIVVLDKTTDDLPCLVSSVTATPIDEILASLPMVPRLAARAETRRTFTVEGPRLAKSRAHAWTPNFADPAPLVFSYEAPAREDNSGAFSPFAAHVHTKGASEHAATLVESVALSMVAPPRPDVEVLFPASRVERLSHEQMETVILATAAFSRIVAPDDAPVAGGFMIGHGTGFGKGRCVAGIILSQMLQGHTKAAWFSKTRDLLEDATRDWADVAGEEHKEALFDLTTIPANTDISHQHGILFSTYATLRSDAREGARSRLDQIVAWLGEDFAGVVVFDESHELGNAMGARGERGKTDASKQGLAAIALQDRLPHAKFAYTSATAASKIEAFAYAKRLNLFGKGTAFPTREDFLVAMNAGGTGAMELLCRDAKALGVYIAASLSLDGVACERLEHTLSDDEIAAYNEVAKAWAIIRAAVDAQLGDRGGTYASIARSQLAATSMRCMQALLTSFAMTSVLPDVDARLDHGYAPVFQIANTYEADQERALAKMVSPDDLDGIDLSSKETIKRYLTDNYPTAILVEITNEDGDTVRWEALRDDNGAAIADPAAVAKRDEMLANLDAIIAPDSPLSQLGNAYGDNLAECTGRARRVVRKIVNGALTTVIEKRGGNASSEDADAFMSGDKGLLVFSESAGGVGRSYHADCAAKNQKPRAHYGLQLGWRAENAIQGFGRTHRTNQAFKPTWILVTTDAPGQRRFISSIARRLEQLGACTRGQRDASGTSLFSASDNLESEYATSAVNAILREIGEGIGPITYDEWLEYTGLTIVKANSRKPLTMTVARYLNQILCCPLDRDPAQSPQHKMMDALVSKTCENIEAAKARGTFDEGVQLLKAIRIDKRNERSIYTDPSGATTMLLDLAVTRETSRYSFATALACVRRSRDAHNVGRLVETGDGIRAIYKVANVTMDGKAQPHYRVLGPSHVTDHFGSFPAAYWGGTEAENAKSAREAWNAELAAATDTYTEMLHLVCGTLLPIYDRLPTTRARIYAAVLSDETRLIGRVLTPDEANGLLSEFDLGEVTSLDDALGHVLQGGTALLSRRYRLQRALHEGRRRIELAGVGTMMRAAAARAESAGLEVVRKGFEIRCFLPEPDAIEALRRFDEGLSVLRLLAA